MVNYWYPTIMLMKAIKEGWKLEWNSLLYTFLVVDMLIDTRRYSDPKSYANDE